MTDNEITKILECCSKEDCENCEKDWSYVSQWDCMHHIMRLSSDLINRLQAENERLNKEVDRLSQCVLYHERNISDAVKEFAEKMKDEFCPDCDYSTFTIRATIDILVNERR